ncbi:MAG: HAMP domain-containing sensor histidine kinase [Chitinophagaceae bacterium]
MRLLKKTILSYFIFTAILLLASVPVFYYLLKAVVVNNADENLRAIKTRIMPQLLAAAEGRPAGSIDYSDYTIIFQKAAGGRNNDSVYNYSITGTAPGEWLPGRALSSHFVIHQETYSMEIKTSMVDKMALIKRIVFILSLILLALLLGLLLINQQLAKNIWHPFYNTLKKLQHYGVDKQESLQLEKSSVKEFNDLNNAIEQLTQRDRLAFEAQKEFTENASHEMQSPLAVFQSKLELLMQTKPLNEEQTLLITDLANASKRMSRLNKSLVLLTRIENNQFPETEKVAVGESVQKLLEQYAFQAERKDLHIYNHVQEETFLTANKTLLEMLFSNLLSNAIRHNVQGGEIHVRLTQKQLQVQNSGKPQALNSEKLSGRFQKDSADENSLGLGLAIAHKICSLYHYQLHYQFVNGLHSFSVEF